MLASARWLLVVCVVSLLGCATRGLPRHGWTHYRVGEVDFYSGVPEPEIRFLLDRFAKFRVVVGELTSAPSVEPRVPTRVFLFPNIPLEEVVEGEVFDVRRESDKGATAYAEAWALTHYLTFGVPELGEKIDVYVPRAIEASDPVAPFSDVFGMTPSELEPKLYRYLLNGEVQAHVLRADQFALPTVDPVEPLTPAETAAQLARMCWRFDFRYRAEELRSAAMAAGEPDPFPVEEAQR